MKGNPLKKVKEKLEKEQTSNPGCPVKCHSDQEKADDWSQFSVHTPEVGI